MLKDLKEKYTMPTVKHLRCQMIWIWGTVPVIGTAVLHFLPAGVTMNGSRYVKLP